MRRDLRRLPTTRQALVNYPNMVNIPYEGYYIRLVVKVLDPVWEVEGVDLWLLSHIGI